MLTVEEQIKLIADAAMGALDLDNAAERRATPHETALDYRPVVDTSSPVQFTEDVVTMIDVKTTVPTEPRQKRPMRVVVAGVLAAAAAVVAVTVAVVVIRDRRRRDTSRRTVHDRDCAHDDASPSAAGTDCCGRLVPPGTYFVDEVDGTPTPRIFFTIGAGWNGNVRSRQRHGTTSAYRRSATPAPCSQTPATGATGITRGLWQPSTDSSPRSSSRGDGPT